MAGTIEYDTDGSSFTSGVDGAVWRRQYHVRGLESGPDIPSLIIETYALVPDTGTPAPAPIPNMTVREASIDKIAQNVSESSPDQWEAWGVITYTTPTQVGGTLGEPDDNGDGVTISSVASVEEIETDLDRGGAQIQTTYDNATMAHAARTFRTGRTITFVRLESTNPRARQDVHQGTLNLVAWNGYGPETVLCQSIDWDTDDYGVSYQVTYTFVVRSTWQFTAVHEDPFFPGRPLPGATGLARTTVDLLPTSDFGLLNITLP